MTITPAYLREVADGLANQNSHYERVAARYAASADMLDALRYAEALANVGLLNASEELIAAVADKRRAAIAKAERAEP